jgi:predicted homoserine dehydrogenase-like protein
LTRTESGPEETNHDTSDVVCAGKGTKYLPEYHASTPDTVWNYYGLRPDQVTDMNPQMFNSFLDGTKSALEMAAVANGCDLSPPTDGLRFPPCGVHDLPQVLKPITDGGQCEKKGTVEVVSCVEPDGRWTFNDLRWGVYVVFEAPTEYQMSCFKQYGMKTDESGRYAAQYKPYHLIGLELGISIASIMVRGEPTGQCKTFAADTVATAKRDLKAGEKLDGEGGFMVYGKLMPAEDSLAMEGLPIGLAHGIVLKRDIKQGEKLSWSDVEWSEKSQAVAVRREMEALFRKEFAAQGKKVNGLTNGTNGVH